MILLADNDIILKLAQCDLLEDLPELLDESASDVFVTPTARYQLLPKKEGKALEKCGSEAVRDRITVFMSKAQVIPEIRGQELLKTLEGIDNINGGEAMLFAAAVELSNHHLMTGDKKSLCALLSNQHRLPAVYDALRGKVVTFESALLLALKKKGFAVVKQKLLGCPRPDGVLRLVSKPEMKEPDLVECLSSYTREVGNLLAFRHLLPELECPAEATHG